MQKYHTHNLLIQQIQAIAFMNYPQEKYQQQLQSTYDRFKHSRKKQRFINELKIYLELKKFSPAELKGFRFDLSQFKNLLIKKSLLIYKIFVKRQFDQVDQQNLQIIQLSLSNLLRIVNIQICNVPFKYSLQQIMSVKEEIVQESINTECQEIEKLIKKEQQRKGILLLKKQKIFQFISLKEKQILNLQQYLNHATLANQPRILSECTVSTKKEEKLQQLHQQISQFEEILSKNGDSQFLAQNRLKFYQLKQKNQELRQAYNQLKQIYNSNRYKMEKLLQKQKTIPQPTQYKDEQLEQQLEQLKSKYQKIKLIKSKNNKKS